MLLLYMVTLYQKIASRTTIQARGRYINEVDDATNNRDNKNGCKKSRLQRSEGDRSNPEKEVMDKKHLR